MNNQIPSFAKHLITWYVHYKRDLPWRKTKNPYRVWLSEIILQQTQVNQGLPYYERFLDHFPEIKALAEADEEAVLKLWQGLGYYSRARNLHATAKMVMEDYAGNFPTTYKELIKLKGIGDYTASAISSICFNEPQAVVDGNVFRVLSRISGIDIPINSSAGQKIFKNLAQSLMDAEQPGIFNQAIMDFGAMQCRPRNPDCATCIFNQDCVALKTQRIEELPVKIKANPVKKRYFNYLVPRTPSGNTQMQQRTTGIWKNLYQFPLLETPAAVSLKQIENTADLSKILNLHNANLKAIIPYSSETIVHKLSHQHLYVQFFIVEISEELSGFLTASEVRALPVPALIANFIEDYFRGI